jgi:hypothetical protein
MATQEYSPPGHKRTQTDEAAPAKSQKKRPPSEFWDNLSRIPLCRSAVHELDRRNNSNISLRPLASRNSQRNQANLKQTKTDIKLKRFSRHGGPDLRSIIGVSRISLLVLRVVLRYRSLVSQSGRHGFLRANLDNVCRWKKSSFEVTQGLNHLVLRSRFPASSGRCLYLFGQSCLSKRIRASKTREPG